MDLSTFQNRINYHVKTVTGFLTVSHKLVIVLAIFYAGYSYANRNMGCEITQRMGIETHVIQGVKHGL